MLATGLPVAIVTGHLIVTLTRDDWNESLGTVVFAGGAAYTLASIPLLIAGKRNKKRALSLSLINSKNLVPGLTAMSFKMHPAISVSISLN